MVFPVTKSGYVNPRTQYTSTFKINDKKQQITFIFLLFWRLVGFITWKILTKLSLIKTIAHLLGVENLTPRDYSKWILRSETVHLYFLRQSGIFWTALRPMKCLNYIFAETNHEQCDEISIRITVPPHITIFAPSTVR